MLQKLLVFLVVTCFCHAAELSFDYTLKEVTAKPDVKLVFVEFPFTNKSKETIRIVNYNAPCSCMEARIRRPDKKQSLVFAPGEKGVIIGILEFENFKGTIDKIIEIKTDQSKDGKDDIVKLTSRVTIPVLIGPDKPSLEWEVGGAMTPKEVIISVQGEHPINILKKEMSYGADAYFDYKFEVVKPGFIYKVTVTPKKNDEPTLGALRFSTDSKIGRFKNVQFFMSISPKKKK